MATSIPSEPEKPHDSSGTEKPKQAITDFSATLISAVLVLVLVAAVMVIYLKVFPESKIVFVKPLAMTLVTEGCEADAERCYRLDNPIPEGIEDYQSVITVVKVFITFVTWLITLLNFNHNPFENDGDNRFWMGINKVLVAIALALFAWITFSAIEVLAGLAYYDTNPQLMRPSVAILTVAVFVSVISFLLIEWVRDIDIVDIGRSGIVILIVSYSLSIPLSSHDWNHAYSILGNVNSSAMIAGGNGSAMLFTLTMTALGLVFMAFAFNAAYIYFSLFKETSRNLKLLVGILGFFAGLGSIIVGIFPTNKDEVIHVTGAYGAVIVSVLLVALLLYIYPKSDSNPASFKHLWQMIMLVLGIGIAVIFLLKFFTNDYEVGLLELEFAYFFLFLLFIQIYSSFLIAYIANNPKMPDHKDYQAQRTYLVPENLVKAVTK